MIIQKNLISLNNILCPFAKKGDMCYNISMVLEKFQRYQLTFKTPIKNSLSNELSTNQCGVYIGDNQLMQLDCELGYNILKFDNISGYERINPIDENYYNEFHICYKRYMFDKQLTEMINE